MTLVWAHRGASHDAPENTLEAFALAADQGADGVELDVQLTADGEVVVIHDETLDRTTDGSGPVGRGTLAELQRLRATNGFAGSAAGIPTLSEVLDLVRPRGLTVNVELKNSVVDYPGLEEAVLDVVAAQGMADAVLLSSFNHDSIARLASLGSPSPLGVLLSDPVAEAWEYAKRLGAQAVHPRWRQVAVPGFVAACHAAGVAVHVWTVDSRRRLLEAAALGVDAVITNRPRRAARLLGRLGAEPVRPGRVTP